MVASDSEAIASSARPGVEAADASIERRASASARSKPMPDSRPRATSTACRTSGVSPTRRPTTRPRSTGTSRQPATARPARPARSAMSAVAASTASGGRKHMANATRRRGPSSTPASASSRRRKRGEIGMLIPAPSPVVSSAPRAPRCARAASASSAIGTARAAWRPSVSATKPTPHASCSWRGSYSGAGMGSRRSTGIAGRPRAVRPSILPGAPRHVGSGAVAAAVRSGNDRGPHRNRTAIVYRAARQRR